MKWPVWNNLQMCFIKYIYSSRRTSKYHFGQLSKISGREESKGPTRCLGWCQRLLRNLRKRSTKLEIPNICFVSWKTQAFHQNILWNSLCRWYHDWFLVKASCQKVPTSYRNVPAKKVPAKKAPETQRFGSLCGRNFFPRNLLSQDLYYQEPVLWEPF
jgi:hypothetical protein